MDVVFDEGGKSVRVPKSEDVQPFVDAAITGDDETAGALATDVGLELSGESMLYRELALQKGTKVDTCELVGVVSCEFGECMMRNGVELMEGIGSFGGDPIKAGDVNCALKGPARPSIRTTTLAGTPLACSCAAMRLPM